MEAERYVEMKENLTCLMKKRDLGRCMILLFGHNNATEELADHLIDIGLKPGVILDNNSAKYGRDYRGIPIAPPEKALEYDPAFSVVLIVSRFYEEMYAQLKNLGFKGEVYKLCDYNTFAEYSLSEDTIKRKTERAKRGVSYLKELSAEFPDHYKIFCPFMALGDVYFTMEYLPEFLKKEGAEKSIVCVVGNACAKVARLFPGSEVKVLDQTKMDETVQGVIYSGDKTAFIAHQDRPYVVKLHRALYLKCIPLEMIYRCGVFGLPKETKPAIPSRWERYPKLDEIKEGRSVILSPYAKSVTALPEQIWRDMVKDLGQRGYLLFTNVSGDEKPLEGTLPLKADISMMKSVLERAGTFIGIRNGLCDVIRTAGCRKIALFPDYNYCDTRWKSIDMYSIEGFESIVVNEGDTWNRISTKLDL